MKLKNLFFSSIRPMIFGLGLFAFTGVESATATLLLFNDFGAGADTGPAFQGLANAIDFSPTNLGGSGNPATGVINVTGGPSDDERRTARGLNTLTSVDVTTSVPGATGFTIDWVVSSTSADISDDVTLNGWFFGVTNSTDDEATGLFNQSPHSFGIVLLTETFLDMSLIERNNSVDTNTDLSSPNPTDASFADGFTVSLTLNSDGTYSASTTGLSTNISASGTSVASYSTLASSLVANTSIQGIEASYTIDSVTITAIPEPSTVVLLGIAGLALAGGLYRRFRR
jgi:hypothetical protein